MIVADTNLLAYLLLPGRRTREAERVFERDPEWLAPLLWRSEFRSVLTLYIQRGDLPLPQAVKIADAAETLLRGNEFTIGTEEVLVLAESSRCSAYDCEFVALAAQKRIPLVTTDRLVLREFPSVATSPRQFLAAH